VKITSPPITICRHFEDPSIISLTYTNKDGKVMNAFNLHKEAFFDLWCRDIFQSSFELKGTLTLEVDD
jgi:hypothetical protein